MRDEFGRRIDYLRVSVTDRCNLSCVYCKPPTKHLPRSEVLSYEEIERVVRVVVRLGVVRVRVTGGEPLVREGVVSLLGALREHCEVFLTTNGSLLDDEAAELSRAGVSGLNVSLDTVDPDDYREITGGELGPVLSGLERARALGMRVKLNAVALRGVSERGAVPLVSYTLARGFVVRFIERMGGEGVTWRRIHDLLSARWRLTPAPRDGVSKVFRAGGGAVGFITPYSEPFCAACSRLRLTSDGTLRPCLFSDGGVSLKSVLRSGGDVSSAVLSVVGAKRFSEMDGGVPDMMSVGG